MSYRIILPCGAEYLWEALEVMAENDDWLPVYSISAKQLISTNKLQKLNADIILHDVNDAVCGIPPDVGRQIVSQPLDGEILRRFAHVETTCLKMMDRMRAIGSFSYHERINHYHLLLSFWLGAIDVLKPDLALFQTAPHMIFDYIIYEVCKYKGIETFVIEKTPILNLIYSMRRFEEGFVELKQAYQKAVSEGEKSSVLWDESQAYFDGLKKDYSTGKPIHLKHIQKKVASNKFFALKAIEYFLKITLKGIPVTYKLLPGQNPENYAKKSLSKYYYNWILFNLTRLKLRKYYSELTSEVDWSVPYVFMALQCQPEKSTCPLGDIFAHQYLAVKQLSQCLSSGWVIYVKEHVSQFYGQKEIYKSKNRRFYDNLAKIKNVRLVSLSYTSFDLIDKCQAVAAITGTVGFEAVNRNKPVLIFGQNWYNGCEGIFETPTKESCREALVTIKNGFQIDQNKIKLFVSLFQKF